AKPVNGFPTQRATTLFAYLVVHRGHFYAREMLAGQFWGDRPDAVARKCLRLDLWRIRETLRRAGPAAQDCIIVHDDRVGFDANGEYWLDLQEFEQRLNAAHSASDSNPGEAHANVERAIELYRVELLEGVFEDWCVHEQERARALLLQALERAMRYHAD